MDKPIALTNLLKQQLRTNTVLNPNILDLYQSINREDFVPEGYHSFAYSDMQIPLKHAQQMLTPVEEALILQSLDFQGHERILEIGTGTGFLTALLSKSVKELISVDYFEDFSQNAEKKCKQQGCSNIKFISGDGSQGWVDAAPYNAIVVTGGIEALTELLTLQLQPHGKIFAIIGKPPTQFGYLFKIKEDGAYSRELIFETNTPLLVDKKRHQQFVF